MKQRLVPILLLLSLVLPLFSACVRTDPADTAPALTEAATAAERDAVTFPAGTEAPAATDAPETAEPATEPETDPETEPQTEPATEPPQTEPETEPEPEPVTEPEPEPDPIVRLDSISLPALSYMKNPYSSITKIGDPYILYYNGVYYMYATSGMKCWRSTNLKTWTSLGRVYDYTKCAFGQEKFWAPECHEHNGKFYLVFSASNKSTGRHSIGIAVADRPEGPFTDLLPEGAPLFSPGYSVIDASLFFDDDGKCYLIYSKDCSTNWVNGKKTSQSCAIELTSDLKSTVGEPVILSTPTEAWEKKSGSTLWNEGPCIIKHNGTYYLMFSANYYATNYYCVGYAMATNVLGPYVKPKNNPILQGSGATTSGSGHNNYFLSPDGTEIYTVYHTQVDPANPSGNRTPNLDKLVFGEDGLLYANGPSAWNQPVPSGVSGFYKLTEGVSLSLTGESAASAFSLLDGRTGGSSVSLKAEDVLTVSLSSPVRPAALWLYPGGTGTGPKSASVLVNGTYLIEGVLFPSEEGATLVFSFSALPAGVTAETLEITVTPGDGKTTGALAELVLQYQK